MAETNTEGYDSNVVQLPQVRKKAKIFLTNGKDRFLVLIRSPQEDTRQGEGDLPGGKIDDGESIIEGLYREVQSELPGTRLLQTEEVYVHHSKKPKAGILWESHFFAGTAEFPTGGIALSFEHDEYMWVPRGVASAIRWPEKYNVAAGMAGPLLERMGLGQNGGEPLFAVNAV